MDNSSDVHHSWSKTVSLSRSLVLREDTNISSLLILGKIHSVSDNNGPDMASLRAKLLHLWVPSGTVNFWPVTNGAFLLQFNQVADLTRVMDGAPWSCDAGGDHLFLVRQLKPELNLVDQLVGVGFTTADLWVQFHHVPVEYFSATSLYALAMSVGVPVAFPDLGAAPVELLRARIRVDITGPLVRSLAVNLDDGSSKLVSVVYEQLPSLCRFCGIIGHPSDHCLLEEQLDEAAPPTAAPRLNGKTPSGNFLSRLGSRTLSSSKKQPVLVNHKEDQSSVQAQSKPEASSSASTEHQVVTDSKNQRLGSATASSRWNKIFRKFISLKKKKGLVGDRDCSGGVNLQDMRGNRNNTVLLTISAQQSVQESMAMAAEETQAKSMIGTRTVSSFQLGRGCVKYYSYYSGSGKNPKIEVTIETQCPPQLMKKAIEWLSKNTGLTANTSYDGKRVVISIVGLQIDQRMAPVDLVAYLYTEIRPKDGVADAQKKPDSPSRFKDMIRRFHDENCSKGASSSNNTKVNGV